MAVRLATKIKRKILVLISMPMLTACVIALGMKITLPPSVPGVKNIPITAGLVNRQWLKAKQPNMAGGRAGDVDYNI